MNDRRLTYRIFTLLFIGYFMMYGISPVIARIAPTTGPSASLFMLDQVIDAFSDSGDATAGQSDDPDTYILFKKARAVITKKDLIDPQVVEQGRTNDLDYLFSSFQSIAELIPEHHSPKPVDGHNSAHSGLSPPAV